MNLLDIFEGREPHQQAIDRLEQARIAHLEEKMDYYAKHKMAEEFRKAKEERDSYLKVQDECMGYGTLVGEAGIGHDIVNKQEKMARATPPTKAGAVASTVKNAAKWLAGKGGPGKEGPTYESAQKKNSEIAEEQKEFAYKVVCDGYDKGNFVNKNDAIYSGQYMIYYGEQQYTSIKVIEIKTGDVIWEWHGKKDQDDVAPTEVEVDEASYSTPWGEKAAIKQKATISKPASSSTDQVKTFAAQGYTIKFKPDVVEIYHGPKLVYSRPGDFANPTRAQLGAIRGRVTDLAKKQKTEEGWSNKMVARRTGTAPTPYSVYIKGKEWKSFADDDHAENVANKLRAKFKQEGKDPSVITIAPTGYDKDIKEDTGSWIVYDPATKQIKKRFKTHTAGKSYAKAHGLGFASSEYYFDNVKQAVAEDGERVDPILIKALNNMPDGLATHREVLDAAYDAYAMELGKMKMKRDYGVTNVYIPKLMSLYKDKHGLTFNEDVEDDWYDDEPEIQNGSYVVDTQDPSGEVFRVSQYEPGARRCWIGDRDGRGWYISPDRLEVVDDASRINRYFGKKRDLDENQDDSGVESAIIRRIMVAHTDLLKQFGPQKVMQAAEEVAYNVGDVDEIGTSDVSAYVNQVRQILGVANESQINEKWSEKYKRSIDCSHPKGFSQRAHCQGRKK